MKKLTSRKFHRLLSVVVGIQLLLWTISGLIFSWNPIKKVRGEDRIRQAEPLDLAHGKRVPLEQVFSDPRVVAPGRSVVRTELRPLLGKPVYELSFQSSKPAGHIIVDAQTGEPLSPISAELAKQIAVQDFNEPVQVKSVELLEDPPGSHSEYRKKELPAWRVQLDHASGTVIYVSANRGTVVTRRNHRWRMFDFFWMLHTMDFQGRDNFNSWLLRTVSAFGVLSVLSGYWLWFRSRKRKKRAD